MRKFISAIIHDDRIAWSCDDGRTGSDPYTGSDPFGHLSERFPDCHIESHDERSPTPTEALAAHRERVGQIPEWSRELVGKFLFEIQFESGKKTYVSANGFDEALELVRDRGFPVMIRRHPVGE